MSENKQYQDNNAVMESIVAPIIKESSMKHGWYQTINNTVHYYQKLFNIALILEQVSNYNNLLREQLNIEKVAWMKRNNKIRDDFFPIKMVCNNK